MHKFLRYDGLMGAARTNIEALLMKHVFLHGQDKGECIEFFFENPHQLAQVLEVDYSALWRRLHETLLFEVDFDLKQIKVIK